MNLETEDHSRPETMVVGGGLQPAEPLPAALPCPFCGEKCYTATNGDICHYGAPPENCLMRHVQTADLSSKSGPRLVDLWNTRAGALQKTSRSER
jgi:hypothetical protein